MPEITSEQERFENGVLARDIPIVTQAQIALRELVDRSLAELLQANEQTAGQ